ncbi:Crp/Fnr family transcriptional regulator [Candidatus Roizmanbacteria bacterium]|nr:Crp/Fnr family transcriptional regulator [Candidatus Roizmanbacteria bacterium]
MHTQQSTKIETFFAGYQSLTYKKGEIMIRAEDTPQGVFYIKNGFVRLFCIAREGKELTFHIFKPKSYFPLIWALCDVPNRYHYQALVSSEMYRAPRQEVLDFIRQNPDELYALTNRILIGLDGLLLNMEHLLFGNAYHRVVSAILLFSCRFGKHIARGRVTIVFPLTHSDIANLAGITRETTSVAIEKLIRKKLISCHHQHIVVNNVDKLIKESTVSFRDSTDSPVL